MTRLRLAPIVHEVDEETELLYVARVPDGPIVRVEGVGPLILDILSAHPDGLTMNELIQQLRAQLPEMPADPAAELSPFLQSLETAGVLIADGEEERS